MMHSGTRTHLSLMAAFFCLLAACGSGSKQDQPPASSPKTSSDFKVRFETTKGSFVVLVHPDWAPRGAARFRELVEAKHYDGARFYRVVPGFVVQWGFKGQPAEDKGWEQKTLMDDPVRYTNKRGTIVFAMSGPHSRTTQLFINYGNNQRLDSMGFAPFGEVVEGMAVVDSLESRYTEAPSRKQDIILAKGNAWLDKQFPGLDSIKQARIMP